jgi:hypothetical protein
LVGELDHQPFPVDEARRGRADVVAVEEAGGIPQQVVADLSRAAHLVAVAAGGGLKEAGVQGGESLQVLAGGVCFDDADVFAGPGGELTGQVLREQRGQQRRGHRDTQGDAVAEGEQADHDADEGDGGGRQAQGSGDGVRGEVSGGAPGQPARGQALGAGRSRGEHADLVGDFGLASVGGDGPGEPPP